jgi:hypothetical protein
VECGDIYIVLLLEIVSISSARGQYFFAQAREAVGVPSSCSILEVNLPKILTRRFQDGQVKIYFFLNKLFRLLCSFSQPTSRREERIRGRKVR